MNKNFTKFARGWPDPSIDSDMSGLTEFQIIGQFSLLLLLLLTILQFLHFL